MLFSCRDISSATVGDLLSATVATPPDPILRHRKGERSIALPHATPSNGIARNCSHRPPSQCQPDASRPHLSPSLFPADVTGLSPRMSWHASANAY